MSFLAPWVYCYANCDATFEGVLRDLGWSGSCNGHLCRSRGNGEGLRRWLWFIFDSLWFHALETFRRPLQGSAISVWGWSSWLKALCVFQRVSARSLTKCSQGSVSPNRDRGKVPAWWAVSWKTVSRSWSSPMDFHRTFKYSEKMVG